MATIRQFEDLEIWQLARKLNQLVYSFMKRESFAKDYKLVNQINASAGSVMDYQLADSIDSKTQGLINYLNGTDVKGQKFKSRVGEPDSLYGLNIDFEK